MTGPLRASSTNFTPIDLPKFIAVTKSINTRESRNTRSTTRSTLNTTRTASNAHKVPTGGLLFASAAEIGHTDSDQDEQSTLLIRRKGQIFRRCRHCGKLSRLDAPEG